ncbi:hypothetical protein [Marinifilum caeruleilacunae]|uniref:TolB-like 6-blade propeller-like n=1 Tax=Marinifilum caeruleilacunae TaxID=2499076 RepID=A0ABX1X1S4_9BACT|nr:hypothetical protein [Marinifilum caeruleilacunae]NOU62030.1 hypothetical protein [Marinifilum caeruleilacunae]
MTLPHRRIEIRNLVIILVSFIVFACNNSNSKHTKTFKETENRTVSVKDKVTDIESELMFEYCSMLIYDSLLVVNELSPKGEKGIHFFNKNNLEYVSSSGFLGRGPGEISRLGEARCAFETKEIFVDDYGKMVRWKFPMDSVLNNKKFKPSRKLMLDNELFQIKYEFINDSISIGRSVKPTSTHSMDLVTTKQNIYTNKIEEYGYNFPEIRGRESYSDFALSVKNNVYVSCFNFVDLLTICDLNGNLRCNVFGSKWNAKEIKGIKFFMNVTIYKNYILASYIGGKGILKSKDGDLDSISPSKLIVFDMEGNYIKTIDVGYEFSAFCVDEDNERFIAYFDNRINPLGWFYLKI